MKLKKKRLDILLVERGLAESREKARRLILAGLVQLKGVANPKPGTSVPQDQEIIVKEQKQHYVSRGGQKLAGALDMFRIDPSGFTCADIGASTGGFTDCLLQRGARFVYAVDVGYGQLDYRLRNDPRIKVLERINARHLSPGDIPEPLDLAVIDCSFISLFLVLNPLAELLRPEARVLGLIKPQFEAGREKVPRGGVLKDPKVHQEVLCSMIRKFKKEKWIVEGLEPSVLPGVSGNREYFALLSKTHKQAQDQNNVFDIERIVAKSFDLKG